VTPSKQGVRPLLLDLYCCAGGAAKGYHDAGFEVVGVDKDPQPNYPYTFHQADALEYLRSASVNFFDAIHASPPCQAFTVYGNNKAHVKADHPNLVPATRELLRASGLPYVIENVPGAPLLNPIQLCGTSFPPLEIRRHRIFESNMPLLSVPCNHGRLTERKYPGSSNRPNGRTVCNIGEYRVPLALQKKAIGIDWMTLAEISQAVPPAFTEHIGLQLIAQMPALELAA
jgi:DNA (cytosine-5)-methyltransferase 1